MSMSMPGDNRRGFRPSGSRIHQGLVGARTLIGTPYLADPSLRAEYARDIAPRTGVALAKILREIFPDPQARRRPRRVLDLGAGTGAAGAAVEKYFGNDVDLVSVDRVRAGGGGSRGLTADVTDIAALARIAAAGGPFDLLVAAHVLNELFVDEAPSRRLPKLATLVRHLSESLVGDGGTLILVEPALRETSRVLLGVRDGLLGSGLHVVAPCFFTGPCPALLRPRDWCHDAVQTDGEHAVDFSYLVVRASGEPTTDASLFRIVSDPLPEKGRLKLYACGVSGRHVVARLDRHATKANADMDQLVRGDAAHFVRTTFAQDGLRVVKDTTVTRRDRS